MRALTAIAAASASVGAAAGGVSRLGGTASAPARATIALFAVLGAAASLAALMSGARSPLRGRLVRTAPVAAGAFGAAWIATTIAGEPGLVGACAVVAGAAVLSAGAATFVRSLGAGRAHATFAGAAVPFALAALVFIADPFVEWRASQTPEAPSRSAAVIGVSPLAAIAADAGPDWQRSRWMYEGPDSGAPGLSVIGRYYWSRPASPWTWALAAAACGIAALAVSCPRSTMSP